MIWLPSGDQTAGEGDQVDAGHFRLMLNCADICRTAADFLLSKSEFHVRLCAVCADVCEACAESCRAVANYEEPAGLWQKRRPIASWLFASL